MTTPVLAVAASGLVTSVGLSAPAACAAIRAKLTNPTPTRYVDSAGDWIMSHSVALDEPLRGRAKLARMAAMIVAECLAGVARPEWSEVPLLLCVAERTRPGRVAGLEDRLFGEVCAVLGDARFAEQSSVIPHGRVSAAVALLQARRLLYESNAPAVLIVATDSLLNWPTLEVLEERQRLLTSVNSNGFIPGEAASGALVTRPRTDMYLGIDGLGFATEQASIETDAPLRADGLTRAIVAALAEARGEMHEIDFRITDVGAEQYYFKEAALAVSRTLRQRKEDFDIWHPAECVGEVGSAIGPMMLGIADAACRRGYAAGPAILIHTANDAGQRAAIVTRYRMN